MTIREQQRMAVDVIRWMMEFDRIQRKYNYLKDTALDEAMQTVDETIDDLLQAIREYKGEAMDNIR